MKKRLLLIFVLLMVTLLAELAHCATLAVYPLEFKSDQSAAGAPSGAALRDLLASRLNRDLVRLVDKQEKADVIISGSYNSFGALFSWDVLLKEAKGGIVTVYEQGNGSNDIIPAAGRLARKIDREIAAMLAHGAVFSAPVPQVEPPRPAVALPAKVVAAPVVSMPPVAAPRERTDGFVVRTEAEAVAGGWTSDAIDGVFTSMSLGARQADGEWQMFAASERAVRYYHKGSELKQVAEVTVPVSARILAVDCADLDRDGATELFVTIIDRGKLSSRIYRAGRDSLKLLADNLPWFFRGMGNDVANRRVYVQEMGVGGGFSAEARELKPVDGKFEAAAVVPLPRKGNIYNFQRLTGPKGKDVFVQLDEDGYLAVTDLNGEELWRSAEKFGGSEVRFKDTRYSAARTTRELEHWIFLEQRMTLLPDGTLLVPRNEGLLSVGNNRNYNRHAMFAFRWNGAVLGDVWHTRQTVGYLADYAYDAEQHELLSLEVVKKEGLFSKGKTVMTGNRID